MLRLVTSKLLSAVKSWPSFAHDSPADECSSATCSESSLRRVLDDMVHGTPCTAAAATAGVSLPSEESLRRVVAASGSPIGGASGFGGCQNGWSGPVEPAFGGGDGGASTSQNAGEYNEEKVALLIVGEISAGGPAADLLAARWPGLCVWPAGEGITACAGSVAMHLLPGSTGRLTLFTCSSGGSALRGG